MWSDCSKRGKRRSDAQLSLGFAIPKHIECGKVLSNPFLIHKSTDIAIAVNKPNKRLSGWSASPLYSVGPVLV